eukprot:scaffold207745_cov19-Tisochrysis_lutea.AAC.1
MSRRAALFVRVSAVLNCCNLNEDTVMCFHTLCSAALADYLAGCSVLEGYGMYLQHYFWLETRGEVEKLGCQGCEMITNCISPCNTNKFVQAVRGKPRMVMRQ